MKISRFIAFASAALILSSCAQKTVISGVISGLNEGEIVANLLDVNVFTVLDTIKTGKDGSFKYSLDIKDGQPEFVYLFHGDTKIAALLLEKGENAKLAADTLGNYEVSGSEGSVKLAEVEKRYADFRSKMAANAGDVDELSKIYLAHYRESVKYVMGNTKSLTVIPVLYENLSDGYPIFIKSTDAIFFQNVLDSLKTVYPDSRYVKALSSETADRIRNMAINTALENAPVQSIPEISLPDMKGQKIALSSLESKVILLHFWDSSDANQKMLNVETLLPLYNEYHKRGFEIYSVCLDIDKAAWGSTVTAQKLPWINVNDGKGANCPAVALYGIGNLPASLLIADGEIVAGSAKISSLAGLKNEISKNL